MSLHDLALILSYKKLVYLNTLFFGVLILLLNLSWLPLASMNVKTQPESRCPELLANYCDMLLRKTSLSKKLTPEEVEKKLKDVVSSFN